MRVSGCCAPSRWRRASKNALDLARASVRGGAGARARPDESGSGEALAEGTDDPLAQLASAALLQVLHLSLNVREIDMSAHTCDGVACLLQLRVRQLSLDNMIADTDSPVLLASEPSAIASSLISLAECILAELPWEGGSPTEGWLAYR